MLQRPAQNRISSDRIWREMVKPSCHVIRSDALGLRKWTTRPPGLYYPTLYVSSFRLQQFVISSTFSAPLIEPRRFHDNGHLPSSNHHAPMITSEPEPETNKINCPRKPTMTSEPVASGDDRQVAAKCRCHASS